MTKLRTVVVTLELRTRIPLEMLRKRAYWQNVPADKDPDFSVQQAHVQVAQPPPAKQR